MPGSSDSGLKTEKGHWWPTSLGRRVPLSMSNCPAAPSTHYDRGWKKSHTCCAESHMTWAAALAVCYFQTAGDKPYLWRKHEVGFDKPAIILHDRREGQRLIRTSASPWPHVSGARPALSSHVRWELELGSPSPLRSVHTSPSRAVRGRVDKACVFRKSLSRVLPTATCGKETRPGFRPGRKAGAGCCGRLGFAFVGKEVRPESGAVSTQAREAQP